MTRIACDNVLAIDTATSQLNLALHFGGDRSVKLSEAVERTHGQVILKKIDDLFGSAAINVSDLDAVVVTVGPGSFTGLRIGLAAAKGIAVAGDIGLLGVTVFELAAHALKTTPLAHVLIPSRQGEFYFGTVRAGAINDDQLRIVAETEIESLVGSEPVYGVGFDPRAVALAHGLVREQLDYDGADLLAVGLEKLVRGELSDLESLEPKYLQKAIAEIRFDERQKGS